MAERERKEGEERDDFEQFARMFVVRGSDPSKSRQMYDRDRNDMALEEPKKYDRASREGMRSERSRVV